MVTYMTFRNVNFYYGDLMRVTRGVQAVRNPKQSLISGGVAGYAGYSLRKAILVYNWR